MTFRELDDRNQWSEGTNKRFKAVQRSLDEGVVEAGCSQDGEEIDALRHTQRVYASTVNAVLLSVRVTNAFEQDGSPNADVPTKPSDIAAMNGWLANQKACESDNVTFEQPTLLT